MIVPNGWQETSLGEIFEFKNGVNAEKSSYGKGIKFINVMDVFQRNFIRAEKIPGQILLSDKKIKENLVIKGDVLFNRTSEVPKEIALTSVYLGNEKVVFGGFVIKGHPKDESLDNMFKKFCFFSENVRKEIIRRGQGAIRTNIGQKDLSKVPLLLPPLPEQKAIADLLSTWDEAIEKTERLIQEKKKRFKYLLNDLIHKGRSNHSWKGFNLGDLCNSITRKNAENESNVLTSSAKNGLVSQLEYYNKSVSADNVTGYYLLKRGDFAYNRSSAKGYPFGATKRLDRYEQGVLSTLYLCFSLKPNAPCESDFLLHLFESGSLNRELRAVCQEGARSHGLLNITKSDFFGIKVFLPDQKQQKKIESALNTAQQEIDLLKQLAEKYKI